MAKPRREKIYYTISSIHPAFHGTSYTYGDIVNIAAVLGINPQHLFGVMTGTMYPHETMIERLYMYFPKEQIQKLLEDFDPEYRLDILDMNAVPFA